MKVESLPPVFAQYTGKVEYIQQVNPTEWSSTCIACGGKIHEDRSWPDRCRWFTSGNPVGWCRVCHKLFWPDKAEGYKPPTSQELKDWQDKRIQAEQERKRSAERALEGLRSSKIWQQYHDKLTQEGRAYWLKRGIPESLQNYWKLGWDDEYLLHFQNETYLTQSATIPLFGLGWQPVNVKHRLLQAPENAGKYRYEIHGQPQTSFITNPDIPLDGLVYAIEGEIKAMVTWLTLADRNVRMIGLPGCTPSAEAIAPLAQAERIILVFDPGAEDAARKMAMTLGVKRCRVLIPPMKIDDAILATKPTKQELGKMLAMANPI